MDADNTSLNGRRTAVLDQETVKELGAEVVTVKTPEIQISPTEVKRR